MEPKRIKLDGFLGNWNECCVCGERGSLGMTNVFNLSLRENETVVKEFSNILEFALGLKVQIGASDICANCKQKTIEFYHFKRRSHVKNKPLTVENQIPEDVSSLAQDSMRIVDMYIKKFSIKALRIEESDEKLIIMRKPPNAKITEPVDNFQSQMSPLFEQRLQEQPDRLLPVKTEPEMDDCCVKIKVEPDLIIEDIGEDSMDSQQVDPDPAFAPDPGIDPDPVPPLAPDPGIDPDPVPPLASDPTPSFSPAPVIPNQPKPKSPTPEQPKETNPPKESTQDLKQDNKSAIQMEALLTINQQIYQLVKEISSKVEKIGSSSNRVDRMYETDEDCDPSGDILDLPENIKCETLPEIIHFNRVLEYRENQEKLETILKQKLTSFTDNYKLLLKEGLNLLLTKPTQYLICHDGQSVLKTSRAVKCLFKVTNEIFGTPIQHIERYVYHQLFMKKSITAFS